MPACRTLSESKFSCLSLCRLSPACFLQLAVPQLMSLVCCLLSPTCSFSYWLLSTGLCQSLHFPACHFTDCHLSVVSSLLSLNCSPLFSLHESLMLPSVHWMLSTGLCQSLHSPACHFTDCHLPAVPCLLPPESCLPPSVHWMLSAGPKCPLTVTSPTVTLSCCLPVTFPHLLSPNCCLLPANARPLTAHCGLHQSTNATCLHVSLPNGCLSFHPVTVTVSFKPLTVPCLSLSSLTVPAGPLILLFSTVHVSLDLSSNTLKDKSLLL